MTDWLLEGPGDGTPLEEEEREGLLASWVATRADLNTAEQDNILTARIQWRRRRVTVEKLLGDAVVRALHRDMFSDVWRWAGKYRLTERNIGVEWWQVPVKVRDLMGDARLWLEGAHPTDVDKAACRFHHRLVEIHPFPNGNGRHAREMTDLLLRATGAKEFTWGSKNLVTPGDTRKAYIDALRDADLRDFAALEKFVRS